MPGKLVGKPLGSVVGKFDGKGGSGGKVLGSGSGKGKSPPSVAG
jgi:hypothetical protein